MSQITLKAIFRYPVKSMLGESLSTTTVDEDGVKGDRAWATRDEVRGGIRGAKKLPQLMRFQATSAGGNTTEIMAPDGETCSTNTDAINTWLSEKMDHEVSLWPIMPADDLDHYRRGAPDSEDFEQELRELFGRLACLGVCDHRLDRRAIPFATQIIPALAAIAGGVGDLV